MTAACEQAEAAVWPPGWAVDGRPMTVPLATTEGASIVACRPPLLDNIRITQKRCRVDFVRRLCFCDSCARLLEMRDCVEMRLRLSEIDVCRAIFGEGRGK